MTIGQVTRRLRLLREQQADAARQLRRARELLSWARTEYYHHRSPAMRERAHGLEHVVAVLEGVLSITRAQIRSMERLLRALRESLETRIT